MKIAGKTDIGMVRSSNQDFYLTGEISNSVSWAVVCDGMGGANGGNIASETAAKTVSDQIKMSYRNEMSSNSIKYLLMSAITAANSDVYDMAMKDESLSGMGTTVVAAIVINGMAYIAHAGDSRAYVIGDNSITQVTRDHSIVQSMIENGEITEEEAKTHPNRNVITRALGVTEKIDIDYNEIQLDTDQSLLICTDGLTNFVENKQILEIIGNNKFYEYPEKLIEKANENGGGDNITVVMMSE